jgi:phosphatidylserine decarboxylase
VIEIGMAEVSGCMPTVIEGQKVSKGEQLGYFQFGGSSHVVVFDKAFDLTFNPAINLVDSTGHSKKQLVNSWLATFK